MAVGSVSGGIRCAMFAGFWTSAATLPATGGVCRVVDELAASDAIDCSVVALPGR